MRELETKFSQHSVTCALQCAGNRRHAMRTRLKEVQGIDWSDAAILNAKWEGPLLRDVLLWAGVDDSEPPQNGSTTESQNGEEQMHVQMACYQVETQQDSWYGGSIPLWRAMSAEMEVVLALKVSGTSGDCPRNRYLRVAL